MTRQRWSFVALMIVIGGILTACASGSHRAIEPTAIIRAAEEIPQEQLLDVGIVPFTSDVLTAEQAEDEGTNPGIRAVESHFMAYHLKSTLHQSSHWGAISVLPAETGDVDLLVKGKILQSNGEHLTLQIDVVDASGEVWLSNTYSAEATVFSYQENTPGQKDAYQDLYNTIANDMARYREQLSPEAAHRIRTISRLKYAQELAPQPFSGYLAKEGDDRWTLKRLPAEEDPMMDRLLRIRGRESMYVDTLNVYYDTFYNQMWDSYEDWRKMSLTEREAMREVKQEALLRQLAGVLLIAGAVALSAGDVDYTGPLQVGMAVVGGQVIVDGFNISKQADIHASALKELSDSFAGEMKPIVMDFQGRKVELTGSVEEQFQKWRELLRQIYYAETGFAPIDDEGQTAIDTAE